MGLLSQARSSIEDVERQARQVVQGIAAAHRGLFSASEARSAGVSYADLVKAESAGELRRVRRGVYALGGTLPSRWEGILAASLAAGPAAVISHSSAATVHRFEYGVGNGSIELTVPRAGGCRSEPPGVMVHRSRDLGSLDVLTKNGVRVTAPARTLVDLSGRLGTGLTEKLLDEGVIQRRWTVQEVDDALSRARANLPGRAELSALLALRLEEPNSDSLLEARVYRALAPLRPFETHYPVHVGSSIYVVDTAWPAQKVIGEIVGRAHRVASRSAFDRERRKLNALAAAGWRVAHIVATMSGQEALDAVLPLLMASPAFGLPPFEGAGCR